MTPIQPNAVKPFLAQTYKDFCLQDLFPYHLCTWGFIQQDGIKLEDYAGFYFTGNELITYPELAKQIRTRLYAANLS